ncbi:MAG: TrkH family potassium uptake protein [Phycisphaerales bacterium]|nr:TrkH family potassium uptake protein [Phycisphaerales bacterium]
MNRRYVIRQLGLLFVVLSIVMLLVAGWAALVWERGVRAEWHPFWAFLMSAGIGLLVGGGMWVAARPQSSALGRKEALLLVALSWLIGAALAGTPFFLWAKLSADANHGFANPLNCYFEAMSGLTTTGATILTNIHTLPRSILLWRATTHWLGGLGIVVLFVAVLPSLGVSAKKLFRVEAPGPEPEGVTPHIRETARVLWLIYLGLTLAETLALRLAGMHWFDAICHTFATLATGGFSTTDHSIGGHDPLAINVIVVVFMVLAGVNFGLYHQLIRRRFAAVFRDVELRAYLGILLGASIVVVVCIAGMPIVMTTGEVMQPSVGTAIREGVFTTVSIQTTTGFCTADFDLWPFLAKGLLVALMFVGGCAGSTGGGVKVIRILIAFKVMVAELERAFRPQVVRPIKIGSSNISPELRQGTLAFVLGHLLLFGGGAGALMVFDASANIDITTAATASAATLCNIGPGLAKVGAVQNYGWLSDASKCVLCLLMAIGRLEVFAILVLFVPRFWRSN